MRFRVRRRGSWGRGGSFRSGRGSESFVRNGPPANCICPKCGLVMPHQRGIPCFQTKCPQCSSPMTRQFL
jgi:hypothetical protein